MTVVATGKFNASGNPFDTPVTINLPSYTPKSGEEYFLNVCALGKSIRTVRVGHVVATEQLQLPASNYFEVKLVRPTAP